MRRWLVRSSAHSILFLLLHKTYATFLSGTDTVLCDAATNKEGDPMPMSEFCRQEWCWGLPKSEQARALGGNR
jgi:hypothetical protein